MNFEITYFGLSSEYERVLLDAFLTVDLKKGGYYFNILQ